MFWSKKEDKKLLPDLPPYQRPAALPKLEEDTLDEEYSERQELPSFPDSLNSKGFSQAAIKDAVGDSEEEEQEIFPNVAETKKADDMEEWTPSLQPSNREPQHAFAVRENRDEKIGEPVALNFNSMKEESRKNSDIFVKLDKFYSARKALIDAQQKMEDINELLKKIREIKMREEQELSAWEREMMGVKSRLNDITVNLFEKVD